MTSKKPQYLPSVGRLLGFASANCNKLSDRRLKKHGLTVQQWIPLTALWRTSPMSESELADYCRMSPSSLHRLVDRMQNKGLVQRSRDPSDQRRVLVKLGSKGRRLSHLLDFFSEINEVLVAGMSKKERATFVSLLERALVNVSEALEDE